jgi:hypothetical protein
MSFQVNFKLNDGMTESSHHKVEHVDEAVGQGAVGAADKDVQN